MNITTQYRNFWIACFIFALVGNLSAASTSMSTKKETEHSQGKLQTATLAGGCFWCLEPIFEDLRGVQNVVVGYTGGHVAHPSYEQVCTGKTGHAESVRITFDPSIISYEDLLKVFFTVHDPTQLNRQGPDVGTQYRSAIFYQNQEQKDVAEKVFREITQAGIWDGKIVTEVTPLTNFYKAEEYHQEYFEHHPEQAYCRIIIAPKVAKFREKFQEKLKK